MNDHPEVDRSYEERLQLRLLKLLADGPHELAFLIAQALGAYPTDVKANLIELERSGKVQKRDDTIWFLSGAVPPKSSIPPARAGSPAHDCSGFPEPHPLDFDWRFSQQALVNLEQKIGSNAFKSLAILGAPTFFKFLRERGKPAHLFDRNSQVTSFLNRQGFDAVTSCDLFRYSGYDEFDCVLADPPWYLDHYRAFIHAARQMLLPGGKLFLSVLPELTRPSAESDRSEIVSFAFERGFDLESREPGLLEYVTPPFEDEALRTEGLNAPTWRSGDLFTFVLSRRQTVAYHPELVDSESVWHTFTIGQAIVKVKWDNSQLTGLFDFHNVSQTKTVQLRSVSRRSPVRSEINVWTSRNVALRTTRPDLLCAALQLLAEDHKVERVSQTISGIGNLNSTETGKLQSILDILLKESQGR